MINYLPPKGEEYGNLISIVYSAEKRCRTITFQVTEDCNLRCTYCYQHCKSHNKMTFDVAKKFIDDLLNNKYDICTTKNTQTIILDFIGGEPFLEIDLVNQICDYIFQQMINLQHSWLPLLKISICSNGVLYFNKKVQDFIKKYQAFLSLTISIDGNKQLHDACRVDSSGNGSYDRAIAAVKHYNQTYHQSIPTKMTIAPENIIFLYDAVINLIHEGYKEINLNCVFEEGWTIEHAKILYQEMKRISNYLLENNLYDKIYISLFDEKLFQPMEESNNQNYCGGIADNSLSLDYQGQFYPCIRYMASSLNGKQAPIVLGNINSGYLQTEQQLQNYQIVSNITRRSQSTDECFYCPIASGCAWCSALNYEINGTPNKRLTYICVMHQARCLANAYYWNKLYKKLGIDKEFKIRLEKEKTLKIISEKELLQIMG